MIRLATSAFVALIGLAVLAGGHLGWVDPAVLLDWTMILLGLAGLAGVLKLPWDLYFEARALVLDQSESQRRGLQVETEEQAYARATSRRLLLLCLLCHALAAALSAGASWASGGRIGYAFSVFFLVSTAFRPLGSFYVHMRARLQELRQRARVPREDARALREQVRTHGRQTRELRQQLATLQDRLEEEREEEARRRGRLSRRQEELEDQLVRQGQAYEAKVDRVCREFEAAVARLTSEKEILEGMRAFVRMVKEA